MEYKKKQGLDTMRMSMANSKNRKLVFTGSEEKPEADSRNMAVCSKPLSARLRGMSQVFSSITTANSRESSATGLPNAEAGGEEHQSTPMEDFLRISCCLE